MRGYARKAIFIVLIMCDECFKTNLTRELRTWLTVAAARIRVGTQRDPRARHVRDYRTPLRNHGKAPGGGSCRDIADADFRLPRRPDDGRNLERRFRRIADVVVHTSAGLRVAMRHRMRRAIGLKAIRSRAIAISLLLRKRRQAF